MIHHITTSTLFPTRRSSDLLQKAFELNPNLKSKNEVDLPSASKESSKKTTTTSSEKKANSLEVYLEELKYSRSEEHTSELQSPCNIVCRLLLVKNKLIILSN